MQFTRNSSREGDEFVDGHEPLWWKHVQRIILVRQDDRDHREALDNNSFIYHY